jgi:hypothetical protein
MASPIITKRMILERASSIPPAGHSAEIFQGKRGRSSDTKPPYALLESISALKSTPPAEYTDEMNAVDIDMASRVLRRALEMHTLQGHRFDDEYMANQGSYGINVVTINTAGEVGGFVAPLYRPTSPGGHVFLKNHVAVWDLVHIIYPLIEKADASTTAIYCEIAKFADLDVILVAPTGHDILTAELAYKLRLEAKGDGSDTTMLLRTRLCDAGGLARSPPHFSSSKFRFLFPGEHIDLSVMKAKAPKRVAVVRADESDDEPISDDDEADKENLPPGPKKKKNSMKRVRFEESDSDDDDDGDRINIYMELRKAMLDQYARVYGRQCPRFRRVGKFLDSFLLNMGRERFDKTFAHCHMCCKKNVVPFLDNEKIMREFAMDAAGDTALVERVMTAVSSVTA